MNYQKDKEIKVTQYIVDNNMLYYCSDTILEYSTIICEDLKNKSTVWTVDIEGIASIMKIDDKNLFIQDYNANLFWINIKEGKYLGNLSKTDWKINISNIQVKGKYLIAFRGKLANREYGIFDFNSSEIIFNTFNNLTGLIEENIFFLIEKNEIKCFLIKSKEVSWSNSQLQSEIAKLIGIYNNQLITSLSNQTLIGIKVETGEILWKFEKPQEIRADFTRNIHLDTETGKIYFLDFLDFVEFDIVSQNISRHKTFWTGDWQTSWHFRYTCRQGECIYFTAAIGTAMFCYWLGIFHIPSMEIVWQYQREDQKETFNSTPQVSENKLYVLDSGGTLHIFEKEEVA